MTTLIVQGRTINNKIVAGFKKRVESIDGVLSAWANAAAIECTNGNMDWLTQLFSVLRLKNGALSKQGKDVLAYIQRHYPLVTYNTETHVVGRKSQNASSIYNKKFLAPTSRSPEAETINGKIYLPKGDFELTYSEFLELQAKKKDEDDLPKSVTAKQLMSQFDKTLLAGKEARLIGTVDELTKAAAEAQRVYFALLEAAERQVNANSEQAAAAKSIVAAMVNRSKAVDLSLAAEAVEAETAAEEATA